MRAVSFILAFAVIAVSQVTFIESPKPKQLYTRDSFDSAVVAVSGFVTIAGKDSLVVIVDKNGVMYYRKAHLLSYVGDSAYFSFAPKIHAGLVEYRVRVFLDTALVLYCDEIVCGDAFLITGQSNAVVTGVNISSSLTNKWLRSFGTMRSDSITVLSDTVWGLAHGGSADHLRIGASWMRLGTDLITENKLPICMINGAWGGTSIGEHLPGIMGSRFSPSLS